MLEAKKMQYAKSGARVAEALRERRFEAYYCDTADEAAAKALELIPGDAVVSWDSTTLCAAGASPCWTGTPRRRSSGRRSCAAP